MSWILLGLGILGTDAPIPEKESSQPVSEADRLAARAMLEAPLRLEHIDVELWPRMSQALIDVAVEEQWMDPRESYYIFKAHESFNHDLEMIRIRRQDLRDVPRLEEAEWLPSRKELSAMMTLNSQFRLQMGQDRIVNTDRQALYDVAIREAMLLWEVLDAANDFRSEFYYVSVRRQGLNKVKRLIGEEAFEREQFPPCVPVWRFSERGR